MAFAFRSLGFRLELPDLASVVLESSSEKEAKTNTGKKQRLGLPP